MQDLPVREIAAIHSSTNETKYPLLIVTHSAEEEVRRDCWEKYESQCALSLHDPVRITPRSWRQAALSGDRDPDHTLSGRLMHRAALYHVHPDELYPPHVRQQSPCMRGQRTGFLCKLNTYSGAVCRTSVRTHSLTPLVIASHHGGQASDCDDVED